MQLADRHLSLANMTVPDPKVSGLNRQTYQRLKLALSLNLRRQIFVAICDDLALRNRLAARLHVDLAAPSKSSNSRKGSPVCKRLVSLNLSLNDPNPMAQVAQWLAQHPTPRNAAAHLQPAFQILGVERLTRQPAAVQRLFLSYLQGIDHSPADLEASLLLWVPRPWFRSIQQSAPEFWNHHTGIFEFVGDPTPASTAAKPKNMPPHLQVVTPQTAPQTSTESRPTADFAVTPSTGFTTDAPPPLEPAASKIWQILDQDLAGLDESAADATALPTNPKVADTFSENLETDEGAIAPFPALVTKMPTVAEDSAEAALISLPSRSASDVPHPQAPTLPVQQPREVVEASVSAADPSVVQSQAPQDLVNLVLTATLQEMGGDALLESAAMQSDKGHQVSPQALISSIRATLPDTLNAAWQKSPPIQILGEIEQLHRQSAPIERLVTAYRALGNFYRERIERGDATASNLAIAIRSSEQVLEYLEEASPLLPDLLNDLGNFYWMLCRCTSPQEQRLLYLEQAIAAYQAALSRVDLAQQAQTYAMVQNNLGAAYGDLARYQAAAENLEKSVLAYQEALRYRSPATEPLKYASTQNNLGTAYWHLAQHQQPVSHLKQAIAAYIEALHYYTQERDPLNYAMIQNNLGTAYWNLAQHEQPDEFLSLAIQSYRIALTYRTRDINPVAYAATQNNLGTACWHLANRHKQQPETLRDYLEQAIAAYEAALDTAQQLAKGAANGLPALTFDLFATYNNLGFAYYQLATDKYITTDTKTRSAQLEKALRHHLQALQGWQQQPDLYQTALGYIVQTVRAFYSECGLQGQNLALSILPGHLLPAVLPQL